MEVLVAMGFSSCLTISNGFWKSKEKEKEKIHEEKFMEWIFKIPKTPKSYDETNEKEKRKEKTNESDNLTYKSLEEGKILK